MIHRNGEDVRESLIHHLEDTIMKIYDVYLTLNNAEIMEIDERLRSKKLDIFVPGRIANVLWALRRELQ